MMKTNYSHFNLNKLNSNEFSNPKPKSQQNQNKTNKQITENQK